MPRAQVDIFTGQLSPVWLDIPQILSLTRDCSVVALYARQPGRANMSRARVRVRCADEVRWLGQYKN